jgi:hypothetical protein
MLDLRQLPLRIGVFYDGWTLRKVSNYYRYQHARQSRLSFQGLHAAAQSVITANWGQCRVVEAHLFCGIPSPQQSRLGMVPPSPQFEEVTRRCGISVHHQPLGSRGEKGVDVDLSLEALDAANSGRINTAVLFATDGDFVPLVEKLKRLGVKVLLLGWHLAHIGPPAKPIWLSARLSDSATFCLMMSDEIESPASLDRGHVDDLFVCPKTLAACA